jgi:hypothetical protein
MSESVIGDFWKWFVGSEAALLASDPDGVVDRITPELRKINNGLGVEVLAEGAPRGLVFTAYGDRKLFPLVREIVEQSPPGTPWSFRALKSPGGFEFQVRRGKVSLDASTLPFEPLEAESDPGLLGIQVFVPTRQDPHADWAGIVTLILTSGLGEGPPGELDRLLANVQATRDGDVDLERGAWK